MYLEHIELPKIASPILSEEDFSLVDRNLKRIVEPGTFQIMIGAASDDIRLQTKVEIK